MAEQQWSAPPAMQIDVKKDYSVSIETSRGTIELTLHGLLFLIEWVRGRWVDVQV